MPDTALVPEAQAGMAKCSAAAVDKWEFDWDLTWFSRPSKNWKLTFNHVILEALADGGIEVEEPEPSEKVPWMMADGG